MNGCIGNPHTDPIYTRPLIQQPLKPPRALLLDLDGTMYHGDVRMDGADALLTKLHRLGIPYRFVTNNSSRTPGEVAQHLRKLGIAARAEQIDTSALAAADYVRSRYQGCRAYVIGEKGLRNALSEQGIRVIDDRDLHGSVPDVVVQGIDRSFDYDKLALAVQYIRSGAGFIMTNPDLLLPSDTGLFPGAGSLGAAIAAASGQQPVVIGKPSAIMMDFALKRADAKPEDVWVVGDNPATDIAAAAQAGCPSILMLTGVCTARDWQAQCEWAHVAPHAVCPGLHELAELLTSLK